MRLADAKRNVSPNISVCFHDKSRNLRKTSVFFDSWTLGKFKLTTLIDYDVCITASASFFHQLPILILILNGNKMAASLVRCPYEMIRRKPPVKLAESAWYLDFPDVNETETSFSKFDACMVRCQNGSWRLERRGQLYTRRHFNT